MDNISYDELDKERLSDHAKNCNYYHMHFQNTQDDNEATNSLPDVPSSFLIWLDVPMGIMLRTNECPTGEWIDFWCDDEPSPNPSGYGSYGPGYFLWTWTKKNWLKNQALLNAKGVPIMHTEYNSCAPCAIMIPYDYVIDDPYNRDKN